MNPSTTPSGTPASPLESSFASFARFSGAKSQGSHARSKKGMKTAVVYTRVSSKEQADKNLSLEFQKKVIEEYAGRTGFTIAQYFGGTHESAKTDGRKEFCRMLDLIRHNRNKVSHILVYTLDRFSRTGGGAIQLAADLRNKYGVSVFAVTQPADTSNASGQLQESIHFLFSEHDNQLRKQRAMAGIKEKLSKGIWCLKPPIGYDIIRKNGERKIVVNEVGKKLRKAFVWKSEGMKNEQIMEKLKAIGVPMYKQKLSQTFDNPFYCGMLVNKMLDGRAVKGTHEKLISPKLFLAIHEAKQQRGGKLGVAHQKENGNIPLKAFVQCAKCGAPYCGYVVKAKGIYYYKCPTKGCKCNKNAAKLNNAFVELLSQYSLREELKAPFLKIAGRMLDQRQERQGMEAAAMQAQLKAVKGKLETLEEKYFIATEMSRDTYERLLLKYAGERTCIEENLRSLSVDSSNLKEQLEYAVSFSSKLAPLWVSSAVAQKEKLQKLVFPEGISYDHGNDAFRTGETNAVFRLMASLAQLSGGGKKGQATLSDGLSSLVGTTRFELVTPCTPCMGNYFSDFS